MHPGSKHHRRRALRWSGVAGTAVVLIFLVSVRRALYGPQQQHAIMLEQVSGHAACASFLHRCCTGSLEVLIGWAWPCRAWTEVRKGRTAATTSRYVPFD